MEHLGVDQVVERYGLEPHPEGGFYRETWRAEQTFEASALGEHPGERDAGTSMLYLLPEGVSSRLHRIRSEELWLYHGGNPVRLSVRSERKDGETVHRIGPGDGEALQAAIPAHHWQTARPLAGEAGWSLVACVVVPGFDFEDLEMRDDT